MNLPPAASARSDGDDDISDLPSRRMPPDITAGAGRDEQVGEVAAPGEADEEEYGPL